MKARYSFLLTMIFEDPLILLTTLSDDLLVSSPTSEAPVSWPACIEQARHFAPTIYTYRTHSIRVSRNHQLSVCRRNRHSRNRRRR